MGLHNNLLLHTDVYKMGHMTMYPEKLTKIYSYMIPRSSKKFPNVLFFGLQYYIREYLQNPQFKLTQENIEEFIRFKEMIIGPEYSDVVRGKLEALLKLGYWPIKIEAVPEGTILPVGNVVATFESTHPDFPWVVGLLESLFLKVWNTCTVATNSHKFKQIATTFANSTCDSDGHVSFQVHDFGYRGCSSEETAMLSGMAHLTSFFGTDTIPAVYGAEKYYNAEGAIGLSVPASEHSVVCSFGKGIDHEYQAMDHILGMYDSGILSLVSDTNNLWNIVSDWASSRKARILARSGKLVFRPDGGYPPFIVAGDASAAAGTFERRGVIEILGDIFGYTVNGKGYKELHPAVGVIFGEGMTHDRFTETCQLLQQKGWASNNFVIGVGGLLLQSHTRDDMGFALKAIYAEIDGVPTDLIKNPITSPTKRSHSGLLKLVKTDNGYETLPRTPDEDSGLITVFDGTPNQRGERVTFERVRSRIAEQKMFPKQAASLSGTSFSEPTIVSFT